MAATALAVRSRIGAWSFWAMQSRGFGSDTPEGVRSGAGAVRDAGGAFGKKEQADEERYFRARAREQLAALKKHHENEISHHVKEIERLQKEIERHKQSIKKLKNNDDD